MAVATAQGADNLLSFVLQELTPAQARRELSWVLPMGCHQSWVFSFLHLYLWGVMTKAASRMFAFITCFCSHGPAPRTLLGVCWGIALDWELGSGLLCHLLVHGGHWEINAMPGHVETISNLI